MLYEAFLLIIELARSLLGQEFRKTYNGIEWSSQFVTHAGKKLAFQPGCPFHFVVTNFQLLIRSCQLGVQPQCCRFHSLPLRGVSSEQVIDQAQEQELKEDHA